MYNSSPVVSATGSSPGKTVTFYQYHLPCTVLVVRSLTLSFSSPHRLLAHRVRKSKERNMLLMMIYKLLVPLRFYLL